MEMKDSGQGYTLVGDLKATEKGGHPLSSTRAKGQFFLLGATALTGSYDQQQRHIQGESTQLSGREPLCLLFPSPRQTSWPTSSQGFAFFRKINLSFLSN